MEARANAKEAKAAYDRFTKATDKQKTDEDFLAEFGLEEWDDAEGANLKKLFDDYEKDAGDLKEEVAKVRGYVKRQQAADAAAEAKAKKDFEGARNVNIEQELAGARAAYEKARLQFPDADNEKLRTKQEDAWNNFTAYISGYEQMAMAEARARGKNDLGPLIQKR